MQQPRTLDPQTSPSAFFGARLRTWRVRRGMSQVQLGRAVHVSGDLIAKIEKAERRPLPDLVSRLDALLEAEGELAQAGAWLPQPDRRAARARTDPPRRLSTLDVVFDGSAAQALAGLRDVLAGCRRLDHVLGPCAVRATVAGQVELAEAFLPAVCGRERLELLGTLAEVLLHGGQTVRAQVLDAAVAVDTASHIRLPFLPTSERWR